VIAVRFRSLLVLLLLACGVGTSASGNDVPNPRTSAYERIEIGDYVSYKRKASFPVALKLALMKWPDRRSCLASPDGVILRWEKLMGLKEIEVCLVRVLAAAESIEEAKLILVANGLSAPIDDAFPPKYADAAISGRSLKADIAGAPCQSFGFRSCLSTVSATKSRFAVPEFSTCGFPQSSFDLH
jgi:hypothetical protein